MLLSVWPHQPHLSYILCICFLLCSHCRSVHRSQIWLLRRLRCLFPNSTGENPMDPAWVPTSLPISYGGWGHVVWVWQLVQGSEKGVYGLGSLQKHSPSLPWSTDGVPQTVKISEKRFIVISFQIFQIFSICLLYH